MTRTICGLLWWSASLCSLLGQDPTAEVAEVEEVVEAPRALEVAEPDAGSVVLPDDGEVISRSKQFAISGGNPMGRGLCAILAEDAKDELLKLLERTDDWKVPVAIILHGEPGDPLPATTMATRLLVVDGVHRLRLDVHLGAGLRVERFKRAVTEMLLYERALRASRSLHGAVPLVIPPWLSIGLREAIAWRQQQSDRRLYAAMFKEGNAYQAGDLFAVSRAQHEAMDEATQLAFRVSAGSMVMALLEQPQGRDAFRKFLEEAASFQGEMELLLRRHFPELNLSANSLAKWWALQLANQGGLNLLTDVMSVVETEERLQQALFLELPAPAEAEAGEPRRVGIEQWQVLEELEPAARQAAVQPAQAALVHLSYRCFPSYRPLLVAYQKQLIRIAQGQSQALVQSLEELAEARGIMLAKAERGRDYLDWFEITRARETSGAFDDYLRLKQELEHRDHQREDPVSSYLDRMNELFDRSVER